jgi:Asp/Glu/hydantoin racemase
MIGSAHERGASAVMVTCSFIGPAAEVARSVSDFPIFRIDEALVETAVSIGQRIGVAATLSTTQSDVVVLSQASMARVVSQLPRNGGCPILSSPELAVRRMRDVLSAEAATTNQ